MLALDFGRKCQSLRFRIPKIVKVLCINNYAQGSPGFSSNKMKAHFIPEKNCIFETFFLAEALPCVHGKWCTYKNLPATIEILEKLH